MKTVILDFDGTIADTRGLIVRTMQQVITQLRLPARSDEECARMIGLPLRQTFTDLIPMDDRMGDLCEQTYRRLFFENNKPGAVPLFPHVRETIAELHQCGLTVTIASSRGRDTLLEFVEDMGLKDYIAYIISADDITRPKPDPEPVIKTLAHLQAKASETLVVGDTTFDIGMGRQAGCLTCGVTYGNHSCEQLEAERPDYIINDFGQLLEVVG